MKKLKEKKQKDEMKETQQEKLRHTFLHTSTVVHTNMPHTHNCDFNIFFTAPTLLHTIVFAHKNCYTQTRLHMDVFYKSFYTKTVLHTNIFIHKHVYTQTLLHTNSFTHKHFYTQPFYTETLLHTDALHTDFFAHKHFYTQTLIHTQSFYSDTLKRRMLTSFTKL